MKGGGFYALSLADAIVAPARGSFVDGAAHRGPFKAVLGGRATRASSAAGEGGTAGAKSGAMSGLPAGERRAPRMRCAGWRRASGDARWLNPHVPNDAREAMDRLASSVESNPG